MSDLLQKLRDQIAARNYPKVMFMDASVIRRYRMENPTDIKRFVEIDGTVLVTSSSLPYPWCMQPEKCYKLSYCPRDPNCGD